VPVVIARSESDEAIQSGFTPGLLRFARNEESFKQIILPSHFFTCRVIASPPASREDDSTARKRPLIWSMIPKSGNRFSEKIMLNEKLERDA
jgi:hypothetical protein